MLGEKNATSLCSKIISTLIEFLSLVLYPQFESYVVHEEKFGLRLELEAKLVKLEVAAAALRIWRLYLRFEVLTRLR